MKLRHLVLLVLTAIGVSSGAFAAGPSGRYVDLPNVRLWIVDSGGEGEPVILLHPTTGNSDIWQNTIPALAKAGYRAIAIDKPGWGRSMVRAGQDPVPVAEDLDALFDVLKLDRVHLIGTANGGYIALDYAAWRPERIRSLVIAACGLGLENDPEYDAFRARAEIPGMREQSREIREISPNYRGMNPQGVERWRAIHEHSMQDGAVDPPLRTPNTPAKLASISVPVFVIAGGTDLTTPSGAMRLWSRHLTAPHEWLVIPEAGHMLVWEQPDAFNRAVIGFLQQH